MSPFVGFAKLFLDRPRENQPAYLSLFAKPARQYTFNPVYPYGYVTRRESRDFSYRLGIYAFEPAKNDLAVEGPESLNQGGELGGD